MPEGGTTPSYGEMVTARELLTSTQLFVMIRPRGGDFFYSLLEQSIMLKDIENARQLGVDGVVFGCLTEHGDIDTLFLKQLMEASGDVPVTFHRAFDRCRHPQEALEQLIEAGVQRILTSGGKPKAEEGIPLLKALQQQAGDRIVLLAGSGVTETNIARIARETGIHEFHFSAREEVSGRNVPPITTVRRVEATIAALTSDLHRSTR
jgi:copper homeostasis protein